jgi:hypothetical protein
MSPAGSTDIASTRTAVYRLLIKISAAQPATLGQVRADGLVLANVQGAPTHALHRVHQAQEGRRGAVGGRRCIQGAGQEPRLQGGVGGWLGCTQSCTCL